MKSLALKNTYRYLQITYFIRYMGNAFFYIFLFVYLRSMNFSSGQLGIVSAFIPLAALVGSLVSSRISKNLNTNRILMIVYNAGEMLVALIFALFPGQDFIFYLIFITFTSLFNGPFYSLIDGYSGTYILEKKKQYSSMRVMGTISYIIGSLISSVLMGFSAVNYTYLFLASTFFFLLTFILLLALPKNEELKKETEVKEKNEPLKLRKFPKLLIYALFSFSIAAITNVIENFFGVFLTGERGVSNSVYGYVYTITLVCEFIAFIIITKRKSKFENQTFSLLLMSFLMIMRPLSIALNLPTPVVIILSFFRGLAWGYYFVYNVLFIANNTPVKYLTPLLLLMQIAFTAGRIIASLAIGEALNHFSYQNVFIVVTAVMVLATIGLSIASEVVKRKENKLISLQDEATSL